MSLLRYCMQRWPDHTVAVSALILAAILSSIGSWGLAHPYGWPLANTLALPYQPLLDAYHIAPSESQIGGVGWVTVTALYWVLSYYPLWWVLTKIAAISGGSSRASTPTSTSRRII